MKHEVRVMQGQGSGSINISSTYGHEGAAGVSIYVGSKHAVEGITKSVALETDIWAEAKLFRAFCPPRRCATSFMGWEWTVSVRSRTPVGEGRLQVEARVWA